ncbi:hypothetical protein V8G54_025937 [Vigna mungo]|uniref:Uncharacterized protein n=1 Tax=Vigna mungo TaxID=3915 RepID=A0AAQ3RP00_VIGMU
MVLVLSEERWMLANLDSLGSYRAHLVILLAIGRQNEHVKRSWSDINKILVSSNAVMPDNFTFINKINTLTPKSRNRFKKPNLQTQIPKENPNRKNQIPKSPNSKFHEPQSGTEHRERTKVLCKVESKKEKTKI